jgi:GTP-binding protein
MSKKAKIMIVGRTNVGKSTLFNRIADNVEAITLNQEGVTRDCLTDIVNWNGVEFELVDTGGISVVESKDEILRQVQKKVMSMMNEAAGMIFVCDYQVGVTDEDKQISRVLLKTGKPLFLAINKADTIETDTQIYEFNRLGVKKMFPISAQHARGIGDLLDAVVELIGRDEEENSGNEDQPSFRATIIGKPNAGKSSLMNLLVKQDFSIVSSVEGTTREAIRSVVGFNKDAFELIDTAGIRRQSGVDSDIERLMVKNSLSAVRNAHLVILMINVEEPYLTAQDLKLSEYVFEEGASLIILFNKVDLLTEDTKAELESSLDEYKFLLKKIETMNISCKDEKNIGKILPLVYKVWQRSLIRMSEDYLTGLFLDELNKRPIYKNKIRMTLFKARQVGAGPIRIELIVKHKNLCTESHLTFFENVLRKAKDLKSAPLFFYVTEKKFGVAIK